MSDRDLKDGLKAAGYSFEEWYFYRQNREQLEDLREKKDAETKKARDRSHLRLIPGGRADPEVSAPLAPSGGAVKKAA